MISGEAALIVIIVAAYAVECIKWLPSNSVLFYTGLNGRRHIWISTGKYGNKSGSLKLIPTFPWVRAAFVSRFPTYSISTKGIVFIGCNNFSKFEDSREEHAPILFANIQSENATKGALQNDGPHQYHGLPHVDADLDLLVKKLIPLNEVQRQEVIQEFVSSRFELSGIAQALRRINVQGWTLRVLCTLLFAVIFVFVPACLLLLALPIVAWVVITAIIWCLSISIAALAYRTRRSMPLHDKWDSLGHLALGLVYPTHAIRESFEVYFEALSGYHPVCVAAALCEPRAVQSFADIVMIDLSHPEKSCCSSNDESILSIVSEWRKTLMGFISEFLDRQGYEIRTTHPPQSHADESIAKWCPRCGQVYMRTSVSCSDCLGVELVDLIGDRNAS
ncbi:MAG: hypothetical protein AAB305_03680 [Candidatus Zixiibacteriota bacterium]